MQLYKTLLSKAAIIKYKQINIFKCIFFLNCYNLERFVKSSNNASVFSRHLEKIISIAATRGNLKFQYCSDLVLLRRAIARAPARISQGCVEAL